MQYAVSWSNRQRQTYIGAILVSWYFAPGRVNCSYVISARYWITTKSSEENNYLQGFYYSATIDLHFAIMPVCKPDTILIDEAQRRLTVALFLTKIF